MKKITLIIHSKWILFVSILFSVMYSVTCLAVGSEKSVTLYTPYTKISVPPGESIDYTIDAINNSTEIQNVEISIAGIPHGWNYILKSGGWSINQLAILPGEKKSISLKVDVPYQVNKGNYRFKVLAGEVNSLPLVVNVSEKGTYKTELTTKQSNMEGNSNSTFTFNAELKNRTADKQLYALISSAPQGWNVTFKVNYKPATSVEIEANNTSNITIDISPPAQIEAGTYKIPVSATTNATSANLELEVVITGTYKMELTTPTGLLSTAITAGDKKRIELLLKNTGSAQLKDIKLSYSAPVNWEVTFEPATVSVLDQGGSTFVYASLKADKKSIPGDYVTNIDAKTPEVSSNTSLRISVQTSMLWGWIGILVIMMAMGSVYYLFKKYGRR